MNVEFVHQMPNVNQAYQSVLRLETETNELLCGSGIILLIDKAGSADWYVYVDLHDASSEDTVRILQILDKDGVRTDQRINDLLRNPQFADCFSGNAARVAAGLGELGETLKSLC
jgi:hypothetical protein